MIAPDTFRADEAVRRIARHLATPHADMGLLAALRRFHPVEHGQHNVFEVTQVLHATRVEPGEDMFLRWAVIVHCLALVRGACGSRGPGEALATMRFSEARLRQLLEADAPLLFDLMPLVARRLAAAAMVVDWWPLAKLLLNADLDEVRANDARAWLARGFIQTVTPPEPAAQAAS